MKRLQSRACAQLGGIALLAMPGIAWSFGCFFEPSEVAEVGSQVAGIIGEIPVERGDAVREDQVVARLMDGVEQAAVRVARARVEQRGALGAANARKILAASRYERQRKLRSGQLVSEEDFDIAQAESNLAGFEAIDAEDRQHLLALELEHALRVLDLKSIKSPLSGVVVERYFAAGERVEEQPILKLARIDPLHVNVVIPAEHFGKIAIGAVATVTFEKEESPSQVQAPVIIVDRLVDAASATFTVRLRVPNEQAAIPAGLSCDASFPGVEEKRRERPELGVAR